MVNKKMNSQNLITKESIFTALMILMEKKNFNEISITEIAKKAGVSRMAFYRNYTQKEDIIIDCIDEFFKEYSEEILNNEKIDSYNLIRQYFTYFKKNDRLIFNLINSDLTNMLLERCTESFHTLSENIVCDHSSSPIKNNYLIDFLGGGLYKVLTEWAKNGMKESDYEMADMVYNLSKDNL